MRRPPRIRACLLAALAATLAAAAGVAGETPSGGDWPRFRGPGVDGISKETGLLPSWPEGGPEVVWRRAVGAGFSGMSIAGGRLYTMFDSGDREYLVAFDPASGEEVWRTQTDVKFANDQGDGPRSTPAVDGDRVYALSARGKLSAVRARDGKLLWRKDLVEDFGGTVPTWGVSTAPLVEGKLVLINAGGKGKSVVALDKETGKLVWSAEDDGPGYASPLPFEIGGVRQVAFFTAGSLVSLAPASGRRYWEIPWETSYDVNAATPIFVPPDRVFVSSDYDTGAALLKVAMKPEGESAVEEVWRSRVMKNKFSSSVILGGHIYGFDNAVLKCLRLEDGTERWKESGLGHGSLVAADGKLIVLGERGKLVLLEASPEAYRELSSAEVLPGKCWTVPTLAGGRLYLRNEKEMLCLKVAR